MTRWSYPRPVMLARACVSFLLLTCSLAWSQVDTNGQDASSGSAGGTQLSVPPPVSGQSYATTFSGETEANYLRYGITLSTGYSNDVTGGDPPVGSMSYSIWPTLALDRVTYRMHLLLNYSPGFTFYQRVSSLNQGNQNIALNLQYRLSPNLTATLQEGFQKTSNIFNQPNPLNATSVSGSVPTPGVAVIVPAADQISNTTSAQATYRISENGMIGGSGNFTSLDYSNSNAVSGIFNSRSDGGSFFYSSRFRERYYIGVSYQYQDILSYQPTAPSTRTQTNTIFFFLTTYLKPNLSLSLSAGPQHYNSTQQSLPTAASWQPMTMASISWQGERTTVAASYARMVSGGGGLNGTFNSNNANLSFMWRASRNWTAGISGGYSNYQTLTPLFVASTAGGHTLSGAISLQRELSNHLNLQVGYNWTHQTYAGISAISNTPNINQVFVTFNFHFDRPL
jgi:hypothetical protein